MYRMRRRTNSSKGLQNKDLLADDDVLKQLRELVIRGDQLGISRTDLIPFFSSNRGFKTLIKLKPNSYIKLRKHLRNIHSVFRCQKWRLLIAVIGLLVFLAAFIPWMIPILPDLFNADCLSEGSWILAEMLRPIMPCELCANLTEVPLVMEMSSEEFDRRYAYTAVPVLVKGAASHWKAIHTFSFDFFKTFYTKNATLLSAMKGECQFFPYKTEFLALEDALSMSTDRAAYKEGEDPWYFGWSNCLKELDTLNDYYERPSFLPEEAYPGSSLDWIFMGGHGAGAGLHIDDVGLPSWQAQVRGSKTWTLIPSPECESVCSELHVRMEQGDVLVVNTNLWYHSTYIHPGEISISIGSEYD